MSPAADRPPLYVDLDGTLLRTDTLWESVLSLVRQSPLALVWLPLWALQGRLHLKKKVAQQTSLKPNHLPISPEVVAHVSEALDDDRRVILISASPQPVVESIAEHVGGFTNVIGSRERNLKGAAKLARIQREEAGGPFDYIGNERADRPIWKAARRAYTTGGSHGSEDVRSLAPRRSIGQLIRACRPHQWAKNLLVFLPLVLSHAFRDPSHLLEAVGAFGAFSAVASAVYLGNDLWDLEHDRAHPTKRNRPLASGQVSIPVGLAATSILAASGVALAFTLSPALAALLGVYALSNIAYSTRIKSLLIADVVLLAGFYVLRVLAGALAIEVAASPWLLMFSLFFFLSLALLKRYSAMAHTEGGALHGRAYQTDDASLLAMAGLAAAYVSAAVLALYLNSDQVGELYAFPPPLWCIPALVLYWTTRTWLLAHRGLIDEDPVVYALKDRSAWIVAVLSMVAFAFASFGAPGL